MSNEAERNSTTDNRRRSLRRLAVGYARVSTTAQGKKGTSLEVQRAAIEVFAGAADWMLVEVFQDVSSGVGARSFCTRQGLQAALDLVVREGAVLIVWDWDRLSRYARIKAQIEKVLPDLNRVICAKEGNMLRDAANDARLASNEMAAEIISRKTRKGMARKRAEGAIFGNPKIRSVAPLGCSAWSAKCRENDQAIADALRDHPDATMSRAQAAEFLNRKGLRTAHGNEWTKGRVTEPLKRARAILREEEERQMAANPHYGMF